METFRHTENTSRCVAVTVGIPLEEQDYHSSSGAASAVSYAIPEASASYSFPSIIATHQSPDVSSVIDMADMDWMEIFADQVFMLDTPGNSTAHITCTEPAVAMPITTVESVPSSPVYSAAVTYVVPEEQYFFDDEQKKLVTEECVEAVATLYCNSSFSDKPIKDEEGFECMEAFNESVIANLNILTNKVTHRQGILKQSVPTTTISSIQWKAERRKEAIIRWKAKRFKRKEVEKSSKVSLQTANMDLDANQNGCWKPLNARQQAAAKRIRERGKFKKAQIKWTSVTELSRYQGSHK